jgi:hypothetical protein
MTTWAANIFGPKRPKIASSSARLASNCPMTLRPSTLRLIPKAVLVTAMITALAACGDPKYQAPAITIAFSQGFVPPASLNTGAYAGIAATVTNDPQNAGAGFSCTPVGVCGTFVGPGGASGIPFCYLAPDSVPPGNNVTIIATARSDTTRSVSATITIVDGPPNPCP